MHFGIYKTHWYCRWCGKQYKPQKDTDRDGFCCDACKMAHHRAYKKYIEWKLSRIQGKKSAQPGTRRKGNAKKRKKKLKFKRPVRIKFSTNKDRKLHLL